jgi:YD repeat-containing protein
VFARRTIAGDAANYDVATAYDALGQPKQVTYPDGDTVTYLETGYGNITGISSDVDGAGTTYTPQILASGAAPTAWGAPASLSLGNGLTTAYTYDYRARLKTTITGAVQNTALSYDDASNVTAVTDNTTSEAATYTYDNLNRLTGMTIASTTAATYTYNAIGNMTSKVESYAGMLNPTNITALNYPAPGQPRPHAVTSTTGTPALTLAYDADGNLQTQGAAAYTYDAENRLKTRGVAGGTVTYLYDASGTLVKRTNADGTYTEYVGGIYEKNFDGQA